MSMKRMNILSLAWSSSISQLNMTKTSTWTSSLSNNSVIDHLKPNTCSTSCTCLTLWTSVTSKTRWSSRTDFTYTNSTAVAWYRIHLLHSQHLGWVKREKIIRTLLCFIVYNCNQTSILFCTFIIVCWQFVCYSVISICVFAYNLVDLWLSVPAQLIAYNRKHRFKNLLCVMWNIKLCLLTALTAKT